MAVKLSKDQSYAYAELLEILSFTHVDLVSKIPKKLIAIFQENASSTYEHHLDKNTPIEDQDISKDTATLLTILALNYWCESEEEKKEIRAILSENEKALNDEIREKYNPDNIFNNKPQPVSTPKVEQSIQSEPVITNEQTSNLPIDTSNLPWYKKIIIKVNEILSKLIKKTNNPK